MSKKYKKLTLKILSKTQPLHIVSPKSTKANTSNSHTKTQDLEEKIIEYFSLKKDQQKIIESRKKQEQALFENFYMTINELKDNPIYEIHKKFIEKKRSLGKIVKEQVQTMDKKLKQAQDENACLRKELKKIRLRKYIEKYADKYSGNKNNDEGIRRLIESSGKGEDKVKMFVEDQLGVMGCTQIIMMMCWQIRELNQTT
ncbi:hypothetical protein SteCoe_18326 [Stentor coeruleus]|uniref:Uncharacterized protein n=1 Tax=Stentor coeruleus TaxID=5963 RepID=A0A1R2BXE0_9CILI|nr:hypothetical protein SteCoe_18326 [Stentor coeruleus]